VEKRAQDRRLVTLIRVKREGHCQRGPIGIE
jgi:hypothetical protein